MIKMFDYIKGLLDEVPADMAGTAVTTAASKLFNVKDGYETKLN